MSGSSSVFARTIESPFALSALSSEAETSVVKWFVELGTSTTTTRLRASLKDRPISDGVYPRDSAARRTLSDVSGATALLFPEKKRDTVAIETPDSRATSRIVGGF